MNMRFLLCIPVYNEAPVIEFLIQEILALRNKLPYLCIVIVNDNSNDGSGEALKSVESHNIELVSHTRRKGVGSCIETGFLKAKEKECSHVCVWPGNLRIKSSSVFELISFSLNKSEFYLLSTRFMKPTNTPLHRKVAIHVFSKIASIISKHKFTDISCGLRVFPVSMIDEETLISLSNSKYRGEQVLTIRALTMGLRICEFNISLLYEESRNYSHLKFYNVIQIISPWVNLFCKNVLNTVSKDLSRHKRINYKRRRRDRAERPPATKELIIKGEGGIERSDPPPQKN